MRVGVVLQEVVKCAVAYAYTGRVGWPTDEAGEEEPLEGWGAEQIAALLHLAAQLHPDSRLFKATVEAVSARFLPLAQPQLTDLVCPDGDRASDEAGGATRVAGAGPEVRAPSAEEHLLRAGPRQLRQVLPVSQPLQMLQSLP